jgi:hypothetical protein
MAMARRDFDSDLDDRPRRRRRPRKQSGSNLGMILGLVGVAILLIVGAAVAVFFLHRAKSDLGIDGSSAGSDLDRLAGRWESTFRDPAGRVVMRKIKDIQGTTETVTWYHADGSVFQVNRVEFRL